MFRESDEEQRRIHPSYKNKPVPYLQAQIQSSRFDEVPTSQRSQMSAIISQAPDTIPASFDTYYDPNHPMADWSGFVKKDFYGKAHTRQHRSQQTGIEQTEHGIISKDERKLFDNRRRGEEAKDRNATTYYYGGVAEPSFNRWETTHQSFERQAPTQRDQLTLVKRSGTKKVIPDPAQSKPLQYYNPLEYTPRGSQEEEDNEAYRQYLEQAQSQSQVIDGEQSITRVGERGLDANNENSVIDYNKKISYAGLQKSSAMSGKSFIHNIGAELAQNIRDDMPKAVVGGQIHQGNKSMILQNYKPLPGYTGKRSY